MRAKKEIPERIICTQEIIVSGIWGKVFNIMFNGRVVVALQQKSGKEKVS